MELKLLKTLNQGFTLLEVVIAMAIMTLAFSSILAIEGGSIRSSARSKQMNIVAMLARNQMVETEFKIQGKKFDEIKKEETGVFDAPYQDYRWKATVREMKFPNLGALSGGGDRDKNSTPSAGSNAANPFADTLARTMTDFLSKAIREVTVSVIWKRGDKDQTFSIGSFWVDLSYELQIPQ